MRNKNLEEILKRKWRGEEAQKRFFGDQ